MTHLNDRERELKLEKIRGKAPKKRTGGAPTSPQGALDFDKPRPSGPAKSAKRKCPPMGGSNTYDRLIRIPEHRPKKAAKAIVQAFKKALGRGSHVCALSMSSILPPRGWDYGVVGVFELVPKGSSSMTVRVKMYASPPHGSRGSTGYGEAGPPEVSGTILMGDAGAGAVLATSRSGSWDRVMNSMVDEVAAGFGIRK